jgi:hypothetical protein
MAVERFEFVLTRNNFHEGGRRRAPLEVCLNANGQHLGLPPRLEAVTDDGELVPLHLSGSGSNGVPKNLRGVGRDHALGRWLFRQRAVAGDRVVLWQAPGDPFRFYRLALEAGEGVPLEARQAAREERRIEDELCRELAAAGVPYQRQAPLGPGLGVADVLTPTHLYECKARLTRAAIYAGVGQLVLYRVGAPGIRLVLVGVPVDETGRLVHAYEPAFSALGIEVRPWAPRR